MFGTTIKQVISNDDKSVKVEVSNGKIKEFDLLVAADGQGSKLRKHISPDGKFKVVDKSMYAIYYTITRLPGENDLWNIYGLGSRTINPTPRPPRHH